MDVATTSTAKRRLEFSSSEWDNMPREYVINDYDLGTNVQIDSLDAAFLSLQAIKLLPTILANGSAPDKKNIASRCRVLAFFEAQDCRIVATLPNINLSQTQINSLTANDTALQGQCLFTHEQRIKRARSQCISLPQYIKSNDSEQVTRRTEANNPNCLSMSTEEEAEYQNPAMWSQNLSKIPYTAGAACSMLMQCEVLFNDLYNFLQTMTYLMETRKLLKDDKLHFKVHAAELIFQDGLDDALKPKLAYAEHTELEYSQCVACSRARRAPATHWHSMLKAKRVKNNCYYDMNVEYQHIAALVCAMHLSKGSCDEDNQHIVTSPNVRIVLCQQHQTCSVYQCSSNQNDASLHARFPVELVKSTPEPSLPLGIASQQ